MLSIFRQHTPHPPSQSPPHPTALVFAIEGQLFQLFLDPTRWVVFSIKSDRTSVTQGNRTSVAALYLSSSSVCVSACVRAHCLVSSCRPCFPFGTIWCCSQDGCQRENIGRVKRNKEDTKTEKRREAERGMQLSRVGSGPCVCVGQKPTLVVLTLLPVLQLHPVRSGRTLHSSPSMHGCIWHHHFWATMEAAGGGEEGGVLDWQRHHSSARAETVTMCVWCFSSHLFFFIFTQANDLLLFFSFL